MFLKFGCQVQQCFLTLLFVKAPDLSGEGMPTSLWRKSGLKAHSAWESGKVESFSSDLFCFLSELLADWSYNQYCFDVQWSHCLVSFVRQILVGGLVILINRDRLEKSISQKSPTVWFYTPGWLPTCLKNLCYQSWFCIACVSLLKL